MEDSKNHKTIYDDDFEIIEEDNDFNYQKELTAKLDNFNSDFDQNMLNEIVLWKVNRYAKFDKETLDLLNSIDRDSYELDEKLTMQILRALLNTKGVQLPMASTILRFRNPKVYQIIDQRVYRIINKNLTLKSNRTNINELIDLYLKYLEDLKIVCQVKGLNYKDADRTLYLADKRINKNIPLDNYGLKEVKNQ
ncbi:MAG: hypothetical protein KBG80_05175 [Breznakibacter sp.]|nr:hypothetical protein [Breznakibacter sp.]